MNTFKKIFAVAAAAATLGVMTATSIPASAAVDIPYTGPSEGALNINNDGSTARMNIINEWMNGVPAIIDISKNTVVNEFIEVEFEITGIGDKSANVDDAGNPTTEYIASLQGQIAGVAKWEDTQSTPITGDGTYTVRWDLTTASESIECLILTTNINFYQLKDNVTSVEDSGIGFKILKVTTGDDPANAGSGDGSTTTTTTGGSDGSTTTTTTTAKKNNGSSSSSNKSNSSSNSTTSTVTKTADAGVVAIVVGAAAAASLAAGAMTIKRKRK